MRAQTNSLTNDAQKQRFIIKNKIKLTSHRQLGTNFVLNQHSNQMFNSKHTETRVKYSATPTPAMKTTDNPGRRRQFTRDFEM